MSNFLKFPCKVIFKVSLEQFAPLRSADAVRRPKHWSTLIEDSLSLPLLYTHVTNALETLCVLCSICLNYLPFADSNNIPYKMKKINVLCLSPIQPLRSIYTVSCLTYLTLADSNICQHLPTPIYQLPS